MEYFLSSIFLQIEIWRPHSELSVFDPVEGTRTEVDTLPNGTKQVEMLVEFSENSKKKIQIFSFNFAGYARTMTKFGDTVQQYQVGNSTFKTIF